MVTLVNEHLIKVFTSENERREGSYITEFYPNVEITYDEGKEERKSFPFFKIFSDGPDYSDFCIKVDPFVNDNGKTVVNGKAFRSITDSQNENIVIVAVPYTGIIKPMDVDPRYEILKAVFMPRSSSYSIKSGRFSYNKIVYLIIRLNDTANDFSIPIEWYSRYRDRDSSKNADDNHKWNHYILEISIDEGYPLVLENELGEVQPVNPNREIVEHGDFLPDSYAGVPAFPINAPQSRGNGNYRSKNTQSPQNFRRRQNNH